MQGRDLHTTINGSSGQSPATCRGALLGRIGRSRSGNVMMMTAIGIIPLIAMIGGAVDVSRVYMTYARLQQACDAGALASRKAMQNVTALSGAEQAKANEFFDFNFPTGTYDGRNIARSFAKGGDGTVVGNASVTLPTTLMKIFGFTTIPVSVLCQATLNIPNTDVMFVLDVTGSMADPASSGETTSKLDGLKQAVKDFYGALGPGAPSGPGRVRYGFMPYSSNVNVGRIIYNLNRAYIAGGTGSENVPYQSRSAYTYRDYRGNLQVAWTYQRINYDVSTVVQNGTAANPTYYTGTGQANNPNINNGYYSSNGRTYTYTVSTPSTIGWNGCIEEASSNNTITTGSSITPPSDAFDLMIDLIPNSAATRWKPFLPDIQFDRSGWWLGRDRGWVASGFAACPREASVLQQYASDYNATSKSSASFSAYVDSLTAVGGTYHDIGLIWGGRFLSQDGIFGTTNADAAAPGAYQVSRNIVFMTDGTLDTRAAANDPWGINNLDGRIRPTNASDSDMNAAHQRRTEIICNQMKGKGFTVWVVGFGVTQLSTTLQQCASDSAHWAVATDTAALRAAFAKIAQTIGGLRLSS